MPRASAAAIDALSLVPATRRADVTNIEVARAERRRRENARAKSKPDDKKIDAMLDRIGKLRTLREQWRANVEEAYELGLAQRNPFDTQPEGAKLGRQILDSTFQNCVLRWASRKQQQLLPPGKQFARLMPGLATPEELRDGLSEPLEAITKTVFQYINISNASTATHETMLDASVSTGFLLVRDSGEHQNPLLYESVPFTDVLVEEGKWGRLENFYRERKLPFRVILAQWPDFDFSEDTLRTVQGQDPPAVDTEIEVIEATVRNEARGNYDYCIIEKAAKHCGYHDVWDERGWIGYGDSKRTGETYRRGPALRAVADARTLQRVGELKLRNAALQTSGLWKAVPSSEFDPWNLTLEAGGIVPVSSMDDIEALDYNGKFEIADMMTAELQSAIKDAMEVLSIGEVEDTAENTLGDLLIREHEIDQDRAASSARMQVELVLPFMRMTVGVLARRGLIPPIKIDGHDVDIDFEGPLAQAQKREELISVRRYFETTAPLGPGALAGIKPEVISQKSAEAAGIWREAIRTDAELEEIRQMAAQAAQMGADQAMAQGQAAA